MARHWLFSRRAQPADFGYGTVLVDPRYGFSLMLLCPGLTYFSGRGWTCLVLRTGDGSGAGDILVQPAAYLLSLVKVAP